MEMALEKREGAGQTETKGHENRFTDVFWTIFGRTELRIGQSRTKNYEESDFDVHFDVAPPNPD